MKDLKAVEIWLSNVPSSTKIKYHPDQVALYSKFTELTFEALRLPSVRDYMEDLAEALGLERVQVVVNRLPASRSGIHPAEREGKSHLVMETLHSVALRDRPVIIMFPDILWPSRTMKPIGSVGIRGFILNSSIRVLIHEMIHLSGVRDEAEARRLTDQRYKTFRRTHLRRFDEEFKPLLKEWRRIQRRLGL